MIRVPYAQFDIHTNYFRRYLLLRLRNKFYSLCLLAAVFSQADHLFGDVNHSNDNLAAIVFGGIFIAMLTPLLYRHVTGGVTAFIQQALDYGHITEYELQDELDDTVCHTLLSLEGKEHRYTVLITKALIINVAFLGASPDTILRSSDIVSYETSESKSKSPYASSLTFHTKDDRKMSIEITLGRWFPAWEEDAEKVRAFCAQITSHFTNIPRL